MAMSDYEMALCQSQRMARESQQQGLAAAGSAGRGFGGLLAGQASMGGLRSGLGGILVDRSLTRIEGCTFTERKPDFNAIRPRPSTYREELQQEIDSWLDGALE